MTESLILSFTSSGGKIVYASLACSKVGTDVIPISVYPFLSELLSSALTDPSLSGTAVMSSLGFLAISMSILSSQSESSLTFFRVGCAGVVSSIVLLTFQLLLPRHIDWLYRCLRLCLLDR